MEKACKNCVFAVPRGASKAPTNRGWSHPCSGCDDSLPFFVAAPSDPVPWTVVEWNSGRWPSKSACEARDASYPPVFQTREEAWDFLASLPAAHDYCATPTYTTISAARREEKIRQNALSKLTSREIAALGISAHDAA